MDTILETKDLVKRYRNVCAVNNVSLSIHKGDIFGFVGANGAGKTTVFNLLTGVYQPDTGSILLDGVNITGKKTIGGRRSRPKSWSTSSMPGTRDAP